MFKKITVKQLKKKFPELDIALNMTPKHSNTIYKESKKFLKFFMSHVKRYLKTFASTTDDNRTSSNLLHLAHYTSIKTLYNMLKSPESGLRLYDASAMNDPAEGSHLLKEISKNYEWLKNYKDNNNNAYLCSFVSGESDVGDQAIYWQSYGRDGLGCSIQFYGINNLYSVEYGEEKISKLESHFEAFLKFGQKIFETLEDEEKKEMFVTEFWKCFDFIRYLYKHRGHKGEQECRYVVLENDNDKLNYETELVDSYNNSPIVMKRFIPISDLYITNFFKSGTKICIGPRIHNKEKVCQDLKKSAHKIMDEMKLHSSNVYCPAFNASEVPYRNLK